MKENLKTISILGVSLTIKTDKDNEYINKVLSYYQKRITEATANVPSNDRLKIAILATLNIIDELFKEREDKPIATSESIDSTSEEVKSIAERILEQIDQVLTT